MAGGFVLHLLDRWNAERRSFPHLVSGACLAAGLLLCSCATPYKPLDHRYGYSERQVTNDVYEVSFLGNGNTPYDSAFDFALLRAAELALKRHAKSFILLDLVSLSSARTYQTPPRFYWTAAPNLSAGGQPIVPAATLIGGVDWRYLLMEPGQQRIFYRPGVRLKVKLLRDPPGSYYPYDPVKVSERLTRKYGIRRLETGRRKS